MDPKIKEIYINILCKREEYAVRKVEGNVLYLIHSVEWGHMGWRDWGRVTLRPQD